MGLGLAFRAFFRALRGGTAAERIRKALEADEPEVPSEAPPEAVTDTDKDKAKLGEARSALLVLSAMQEKGRLLDFLQEELEGVDDGDIGAAARAVHAGCKDALAEYFELAPLAEEAEGDTYEVSDEIDPNRVKLVGTGSPPTKGTVTHRGWQVVHIDLPKMLGDVERAKIVAPVQVDLGDAG